MSSLFLSVLPVFVIVAKVNFSLAAPSEPAPSSGETDPAELTSAPVSYPDVQGRQKSCWRSVVEGRRLHPQFIVRSVWAASLAECQRECQDVLFNCETIAYGENHFKNTTCDLSDWESSSLSLLPVSSDTITAPTFSIYSRYGGYVTNGNGEQRCNAYHQNNEVESIQKPARPLLNEYEQAGSSFLNLSDDVCYSVVFTGRRLSQRYVERSVAVISLDECKLLCTRETSFDCRSFNYRRRGYSTNCDLSREDSASLDVTSSYVFYSDPDIDYYQRVGKGQSCYRPYARPPSSVQSSSANYFYIDTNQPSFTHRPIPSIPSSSSSSNSLAQAPSSYGTTTECFRRLKSGYRLDARIVRDSFNVRGVYLCELECKRSRTFVCRSFSYRLVGLSYNLGLNNCDLSDLEPRDLDPVRHLVVDRDADIYERNLLGRNCRETPVTIWNNQHQQQQQQQQLQQQQQQRPAISSPTLCFLRIKSGVRLNRGSIRYTLTVNSPIECEQECLNSKFFTCRSFSFRFSPSGVLSDSYHKAYDNCDLSDVDMNSLDPIRDMIDDRLYDTWQRTSYTRDCSVSSYRLPDTNDGAFFNRDDSWSSASLWSWLAPSAGRPLVLTIDSTSRCYVTYRRGFRMTQRLVRDSIHVRNLVECELECSRTRPFACHTFQFRHTNLNGGYDRNPYNCDLSEAVARDFDRFTDMVEDQDYELFTRSQHSSCSPGLIGANTQLSAIMASTVSTEVTVSGARCRPGSRCRPHRDLGYWYCEVSEANNVHNWDYCCQPNSRCGYSNGFHYPWCYVGPEASEQWRPCSDRYAARPYDFLHKRLPPNSSGNSTAEPIAASLSRPLKDPVPVQAIESNLADSLGRSNTDQPRAQSGALTKGNLTRILVVTNCSDASFDALMTSLRAD